MQPASPGSLRRVLIFLALGLALAAQQLVIRPRQEALGWTLFVLAGLLLVAGAWRREAVAERPLPSRPVMHWRRLAWALAAVAAVAATTWLSGRRERPLLALVLWLAAFLLASLAARGSVLSPPARASSPWTRNEGVALAAILVLGAVARTIWIDDVPRYYFDDESRVGIFLRDAFRAGFPNVFTMGWNSWPVVGMALQGIFAPFAGLNTTSLRLSSSLSGTLSILTTYLLARQLFSPRTAILAGSLFACGRTAIDFSRMGVTHAQVPLFETLAFACWWQAINSGRALAYLWAGIGLGLCLHTYNSGQLVPLLWAGWVGLSLVLAPRTALRCWRGAAITAIGLILTILPYFMHVTDHLAFERNWREYTGMARSRQVASQVVDAWNTLGPDAAWRILRHQSLRTWLGFGVVPADAYALGYRGGGMLDHVSAPLFVLGLIFAAANLHRPRYAFLIYWWLVTAVMGGVLTQAPPAFVRLVGLLPVLALLGALPLDLALRATAAPGAKRIAARASVAALLAVMVWDNWRTYFVAFPQQSSQPSSELVRYLTTVPADTVALLTGAEHFLHFGTEIYDLNLPGRRRVNVGEPSQLLPLRLPANENVALIFGHTQLTLAEYAQSLYPNTKITDAWRSADRQPMFRALLLTPAQIAARQGLRLEVLDATETVIQTAVADPFTEERQLPESCTKVRWSGSLYWPTDRAATLLISGGSEMTLAHRTIPRPPDTQAVRVALQLPRGWQPLSFSDSCRPAEPLVMSVEHDGRSQLVQRHDLRPDGEEEGLMAVYTKNDQPVLTTIEPHLNCFAVEDLLRRPNGVPVHTPFTVSWTGLLQVDVPGMYEFEAEGSGSYVVTLDGETLLQQSVQKPEEPRRARAKRELASGAHPLAAVWDSTRRAHTSRRLFQLYWTPPEGRRELIPPPHFRRSADVSEGEPLPTLAIPPTPTPIALAPGERVALTELQATSVSFGFAPPRINQSWGGPPITMGGIEYERGIGVHAWCRMTYPVPSNAAELQAIVGLSDGIKECPKASVTFEIRDVHDRLLYESGIVDVFTPPKLASARVEGTPAVTLIVTDGGNGIDCDHANWAEPSFILR
jgi:4-amino-4-deoxy-L-arabinose transferase-like glycosyltransferase